MIGNVSFVDILTIIGIAVGFWLLIRAGVGLWFVSGRAEKTGVKMAARMQGQKANWHDIEGVKNE